ncbi:hypothetical protein LV75_002706 [Actinokineospora diospyrosa]|uniref:Uncharacterized protein n=1 Tax=Actinokineospora diospyrosa TaxID=103728 RepID=A0ABT1IC44_9PSEU|nr:hypothetical protein [Actinokineospora diospyrosa]
MITTVLVAPRHRGRFLGAHRPGVVDTIIAVAHRGLPDVPLNQVLRQADDATA